MRGRLLQRPRVEEGREAPPVGARGCISEVMSRLRSFLLSGVLNNRLHRRTPRYTNTGTSPGQNASSRAPYRRTPWGAPGWRFEVTRSCIIIERQHAIITHNPTTPTQGEQDSHLLIIPVNEKTKVVAVHINPQKLMLDANGQFACQLRVAAR